jgi:putative ABC transport system substrate-binding protein
VTGSVGRRRLLAALSVCAAAPLIAACRGRDEPRERATPVRRLGFPWASSAAISAPLMAQFRAGMAERGWVEDDTYTVELRHADGQFDRLPDLVAELLQIPVDLLVVSEPRTLAVARQATAHAPIVAVATSTDPVAEGWAMSLARPGGGITGLAAAADDLWTGRQVAVLKEALPALARIGALWDIGTWGPHRLAGAGLAEPFARNAAAGARSLDDAARTLGLHLHVLEVEGAAEAELEAAFAAAARAGVEGVVVAVSVPLLVAVERVMAVALRYRLPVACGFRQFYEAGALACYRPDFGDLYRRAAGYADRILKGAAPGDLPIEGPTKFEFLINLRTARALGLTIPPSVLAQATEVIE